MTDKKYAFIFPGQGSQFIGMGKDLYESFATARDVFDEVNDALSQRLTGIMFGGPEGDLNLTENTQPALMAVSVAVAQILQKEFDCDWLKKAHFVAGHSLGEYSALTAAGSFSVADCARLLKKRGQAMQQAVPVGMGSMAAILGLEMDAVSEIASEAAKVSNAVCSAANDNSPGQIVISGHAEAVEAAVNLASARGAKRSVILPVSAPFHCALMQPAADVMATALTAVEMQSPVVPVISNVTAKAERDPETIRDLLVEQITGMVRWRASVDYMATQGITDYYELGAGKVLSGLVKRSHKEANLFNACTPQEIEDIAKILNG